MDYKVKLTDHAIAQLQEAVIYISKVLQASTVAKHWAARIKKELASLSTMPARYPLTEEEPWHTEGIHKMSVENFLVYYWIDEEKKIVWITAIVYARRDQLRVLREMPPQ
ncbi:MAG: type II toxin-antitoxin system RelE/ParE family toxin [Bacteroidaceae bacterium]|nr:type II toxin-antitoxin system RelE/ParE family toxin [Bacteroidaceae bacterium]